MGRVKRFKILKTAIKKYGAPVTTAGTAFYKYDQFDKGLSTYTVTGQARTKNLEFKLIAFGMPSTADQLAISASGRTTASNLSTHGLSLTELGLTAIAATDTVIQTPNFLPAKIIVKKFTVGAATPSQITGVSYKPRTGESYTFPFGAKTAGNTMYERMGALTLLVKATTGNFSVTYKPERMFGTTGV